MIKMRLHNLQADPLPWRWPPERLGGNRNIVCNGLTAKQTGEEGVQCWQIGEGVWVQSRAVQSKGDRRRRGV